MRRLAFLCNIILMACSICTEVPAQTLINDPWYQDAWGSKLGYVQYLGETIGRTPVRPVYVVVIDTGCKPDADIVDGTNDADFIGGTILSTHATSVP